MFRPASSFRRLLSLCAPLVLTVVVACALGIGIFAATVTTGQSTDVDVLSPDISTADSFELPPPGKEIRIPLAGAKNDAVQMSFQGDRISLVVRDAPLRDVVSMLAEAKNLNIIFGESLDARVTITLKDTPLEDALTSILSVAGYRWSNSRGIIHVTRLDQANLPAHIQGRQMRVFTLDFTAAGDMVEAVSGLLTPVGRAYVLESNPIDNRRTKESIAVEDLPEAILRIEEYLAQVDQPPRQVLIQVHVLQVELKDDLKHGVNFDQVLRLANTQIRVESVGFADDMASPAHLISLQGTDLSALVELLQTTTDAKTIASPRVLCLNGQEARIQVGEQLGFRVTTTTETSTLESVEFLDVGVVLRVVPRISRDNRVMIQVKPEVSSGSVNPLTGLPEEETTEVETNVLLHDGQAIVLGGLIQEIESDVQSKVPVLGDKWRIGKLFQKRQAFKQRSEIIIALVPYILPYDECNTHRNCVDVARAATPLLYGPLQRVARPWEARLPSAYERPVRLPSVFEFGCCDGPAGGPTGVEPIYGVPHENLPPPANPAIRQPADSESAARRRHRPQLTRLPPLGPTRY